MNDNLTRLSARALAAQLQSRAVSAVELVDACVACIERINPRVNAIVTLDVDGARATAAAIDRRRAAGDALGPFAGLPIAIKDMEPTRGMRTTFGSPIFRDHVPSEDSWLVERLRGHGFVVIGKTNTPEFAMGSQTFNPIFGATRNRWDLRKTCGGSSGGAAVAVATRMLPFADGSDLGGSLRNPGNFNSVVGLRPSPGRVAAGPAANAWSGLSVHGPIARDAGDAAFLLAAMAGGDRRDPLTIDADPARFLAPLERDWRGARIAYSPTMGGLPVEPAVAAVIAAAARALERLGCIVEEVEPDFSDADLAFDRLRALQVAEKYGHLLPRHRAEMKDTAVWNIERAYRLSVAEIVEAQLARSRAFAMMQRLLSDREFLVGPVNQVAPFDADVPYITEINGEKMPDYIAWMRSCTRISATSHPAASVPAGFTAEGLPVGLQIVGRYRDELGILQFASAFERLGLASAPHAASGHALVLDDDA